MAENENANAIADNAAKPRSVSVDGQSVTQHSIPDQIMAEKFRRSQAAQAGGASLGGVRIQKIRGSSSA